MIFRPCIGCIIRSDCEIKKSTAKAIRGQPITSATIRCGIPFEQHFPPGTRVYVTVPALDDADEYKRMTHENAAATVIGPSGKTKGKLVCLLDEPVILPWDENKPLRFRIVWPKDATRLDEPRADWCPRCKRGFVDRECRCDVREREYP